jgi:hypothetical protein
MRQTGIILIAMVFTSCAFAQRTFNIQAGTSISKIYWDEGDRQEHGEYSAGVSVFAGLDYLHTRRYNLSTNFGYIRKGTKEIIRLVPENIAGNSLVEPVFDYLSFNTKVDLKCLSLAHITSVASLGPRIDYLISRENVEIISSTIGKMRKTSIGLIAGAGLKYDLPKYEIGLRGDYYLNFMGLTKLPPSRIIGGQLFDKTFTVNLTFGFKLS